MTSIAAALAVFLMAFSLRQKPGTAALVSLVMWVLLPMAMIRQLFAGGFMENFHPAALLAIAAISSTCFDQPRMVFVGLRHSHAVFVLTATGTMLLVGHVALVPNPGTALIVDQLVATFALVWLCLAVPMDERLAFRIRAARLIVLLATLEAALAVLQSILGRAVPFAPFYERQYYWFDDTWQRWMGTLDHPLVLGVLLSTGAFLLPCVRRVSFRFAAAGLFFAAMLGTESRTGIVALALALAYLIFASRMTIAQRLGMLAVVTAGSAWAWARFVESATYSRFAYDGQSSYARGLAWSAYLRDEDPAPFWPGGGATATDDWAATHGLISSPENPLITFSINFGWAFTSLYVLLALAVLISAVRRRTPLHIFAAAATGLGLTMAFSSLAVSTALPALVWIPLTLASMGRLPEDAGVRGSASGTASLATGPSSASSVSVVRTTSTDLRLDAR